MKKVLRNLHFPMLILMIIYSIFGLLMIFSASSVAAVLRYQVSSNYFFIRQLIWVVVAYIIGFIVLSVPTKLYRFGSKIAMYGILFLLGFIFAAGSIFGGAQSWYDMGFFNFQPTELAKLVLIVYMAVYYHRVSSKKNITFWYLILPLVLVIIVFIIICFTGEFSTV